MKVKIFDVNFGFTALIIDDAQEALLIGCSWKYNKELLTTYVAKNTLLGIERLIIPTYKEEHLVELSRFVSQRQNSSFPLIIKNPSIDTSYSYEQQLRDNSPDSKLSLLANSTKYYKACHNYMTTSGIEFQFFWNNYPELINMDSLSLVTFMSYKDTQIAFTGDLDKRGWENLLQQKEFQKQLKKSNFFVASHSGQEKGYCSRVFDYCQPELILISNNINRPVSEEIKNLYKGHAKGFKCDGNTYHLVSTSQFGAIDIQQSKNTQCQIKNLEIRLKSEIYF